MNGLINALAPAPTKARQCGDCQDCCRLLENSELSKPRHTRCPHQRFRKGCAIYDQRPLECRLWSCAWLSEPDTQDLLRPDRSHYIVDTVLGLLALTGADNRRVNVTVVPIWVDPKFPEAYRDPKLFAFLLVRASRGQLGFVNRAFVLIPPGMSGTGDWLKMPVEHASHGPSLATLGQTSL